MSRVARGGVRGPLKGAQNLGPDGNHADEQADGSESSGFFDNGAEHDVLPEQTENIVLLLFLSQATIFKFSLRFVSA